MTEASSEPMFAPACEGDDDRNFPCAMPNEDKSLDTTACASGKAANINTFFLFVFLAVPPAGVVGPPGRRWLRSSLSDSPEPIAWPHSVSNTAASCCIFAEFIKIFLAFSSCELLQRASGDA